VASVLLGLVEMKKTFALMASILLLTVLYVGLVSPVLSTKGSYPGVNGKIAYARTLAGEESPEIFAMNNDGTGSVQLTDNDVYDNFPCWSPDGTKIAFIHGDYPGRQVWVMDADGTNQKQLTATGDYVASDPAWSPDGSKIAYARENDGDTIYVIDAAGPVGAGTLLISGARHPSWSPDGSEIAYEALPGIKVADATTGTYKRTLIVGTGETPCWSPDGTKIVFEGSGQTIWVMNAADGSNPQQLTDDIGHAPNWSPDGTIIAFWRSSDSIWVMNADGSNEYDLNPSLRGSIEPDYQRLPPQTPTTTPRPVGGVALPIKKLEILTPYLALAGLVIGISAVVVKKRRT
jgi:TolB protein